MFRNPNRLRVGLDTGPDSLTKQSCKSECDINNIIKQYQKTGILTHTTPYQPLYTELPPSTDYQDALNTIIQAEDAFNTLPAKVRDHFKNDPASFLAGLSDPALRPQLEEWGVFKSISPSAVPNVVPPAPPIPPA
ncbi:MAG: internal scaffolding protein [Microvirus sp.]|nr:MAG: internal scaffolding protein [Microvirus sp.]